MPIPSTQAVIFDEDDQELPVGEVGEIIVVKKDPLLTADDLMAHCRKHLTGDKVPKVIEFREAPLPKTTIGKILPRQLQSSPVAH